jgi:DNA-binding response OmpR family regulator
MKKVLIVEDEKVLADVEKEEFSSRGYEVQVAKDGDEAMEMVKSFKPDLIVLDLIMPRKGGLEVLKELKEDSESKEIPVVVLTNLSEDKSVKEAMDMGAADYFVKTQNTIYEMADKAQNYLK